MFFEKKKPEGAASERRVQHKPDLGYNPYMPQGFKPKEFKVEKASSLDYGKGDRVRHRKFGEGTVTDIVNGAKDFEVTVDFDKAGTKRLFASFAKLEKI